ncbi:MAG: toll/interleukin-1 receptor domain-containing protein, partial [Polyangiaceae bacterium]|nr:toll/interleukin-1 receptor domain-containing protein [Polyangiaceae bacterium]
MPVDVFFLYSQKDEALRDELATHLAGLRRQGIIHDWHDRRIGAGDDRRAVIDAQLDAARVILLLVSADFLASDDCEADLRRALLRQRSGEARLIPILLRACSFEEASFAALEALPRGGRAVTSWPNRDEAWREVAEGIRDVVEEIEGPWWARRRPASSRRAPKKRRKMERGSRGRGRGLFTRSRCRF